MLINDTAESSNPIKLTTPISSLVNFVLPDYYASTHATLEDALSHRTGMPRHDLSYGGPNYTVADVVENLRNLPMTREIRQEFQYCNMMFIVLSHVIETITQTWLGTFLLERIWKPLGMDSTFLSLADAEKGANGKLVVARGYFWNNDSKEYGPEDYLTTPILSGAGGIISSVADYAKYLRAMMRMDPQILSQDAYRELRTPRIFDQANPEDGNPLKFSAYGLGWQMGIYRGLQVFHHGGSVTGFGTLMAYIPEKEFGVSKVEARILIA